MTWTWTRVVVTSDECADVYPSGCIWNARGQLIPAALHAISHVHGIPMLASWLHLSQHQPSAHIACERAEGVWWRREHYSFKC